MIGIFPELNPASGGVYQYGLTMLDALRELGESLDEEFVLFARGEHNEQVPLPPGGWRGWRVRPVLPPSVGRRAFAVVGRAFGEERSRRAAGWLRRGDEGKAGREAPDPEVVRFRPEVGRWFRECGAELMLYPAPSSLSFEAGLASVMAIHDLQHRLHPEFPEVSAGGERERREYLYRNAARRATILLVADSEVGREDILNLYGEHGATPERVKVLPFLPAPYLSAPTDDERRRARAAYRLPERYVFYPAQFWPHKNHARLVRALHLLKQERGEDVDVVFCGSHAGELRERTFREVTALAARLGVSGQIHYLGYVPDEDMSCLYAEAEALVMPTFFGPTNIPVLEAWALGCPVLTSDIRGVREQAGDAALLADPRSEEEIADAVDKLWTDAALRRELAARGRRRLTLYSRDDYRARLKEIVEEAKTLARAPRHSASAVASTATK